MLLSDCCWPHRDGFIPSAFIAYHLQTARWDALKRCNKNPENTSAQKMALCAVGIWNQIPRSCAFISAQELGYCFYLKLVAMVVSSGLLPWWKLFVSVTQQRWQPNVCIDLQQSSNCGTGTCPFTCAPQTGSWNTQGPLAVRPQGKWETSHHTGVWVPAAPEAAETSDKMEMLKWKPTDLSPGVTLPCCLGFAAPPGTSGKFQVSRFESDGKPCLTFRSADTRVSPILWVSVISLLKSQAGCDPIN